MLASITWPSSQRDFPRVTSKLPALVVGAGEGWDVPMEIQTPQRTAERTTATNNDSDEPSLDGVHGDVGGIPGYNNDDREWEDGDTFDWSVDNLIDSIENRSLAATWVRGERVSTNYLGLIYHEHRTPRPQREAGPRCWPHHPAGAAS